MDQISRKTNSWKVALRKNRNLTKWLEVTRERKLKLAYSVGWISRLRLENELAELSNRLAVKCWLKHAGKETIKLMENGKLKNMVIELKGGYPWSKQDTRRGCLHILELLNCLSS